MVIQQHRHEHLANLFGALGDPTRVAIVARLSQGEATVGELMRPFDLSQPAISKHLKVLERAGLVEVGRHAQERPRRLVAERFVEIAEWLEPLLKQWERKFERLEQFLVDDEKETQHAPKTGKRSKDPGRR